MDPQTFTESIVHIVVMVYITPICEILEPIIDSFVDNLITKALIFLLTVPGPLLAVPASLLVLSCVVINKYYKIKKEAEKMRTDFSIFKNRRSRMLLSMIVSDYADVISQLLEVFSTYLLHIKNTRL